MRNLFEQVPELLSGENLKQKMTVLTYFMSTLTFEFYNLKSIKTII